MAPNRSRSHSTDSAALLRTVKGMMSSGMWMVARTSMLSPEPSRPPESRSGSWIVSICDED